MTCANQDINGVTRDGGYGEFVTLRTEAMMAVPADMDPALAAPLVCAGITVFNSLRNMDIHTGDVVGVQGIGGLGESLALCCCGMGTDEAMQVTSHFNLLGKWDTGSSLCPPERASEISR